MCKALFLLVSYRYLPVLLLSYGVEVSGLSNSQSTVHFPFLPEIGLLTNLIFLDLSRNPSLESTIPETIGSMTSLETLWLFSSAIHGRIPPSIGNMTSNLSKLNLSNNRLTGGIPATFRNLIKLQEIEVQGNMLSGTISGSFCATLYNQLCYEFVADCVDFVSGTNCCTNCCVDGANCNANPNYSGNSHSICTSQDGDGPSLGGGSSGGPHLFPDP